MIIFSKETMEKSKALIDTMEGEVGWYGYVIRDGNNLIIKDICAPIGQTVSAALCTIQKEGDNELIDFEDECREKYGDGGLHAWFHSHVNMGTTPSSTDDNTFKNLSKDKDYFIRIIMNKQNSIGITLSVLGYSITITSYETESVNEYSAWAKERGDLIKEFSTKHKQPVYTTYHGYGRTINAEDIHQTTIHDLPATINVKAGFNSDYEDDYIDPRYVGDDFYNRNKKKKDTDDPITYTLNLDDATELYEAVPKHHIVSLGFTKFDLQFSKNIRLLLCVYPLIGAQLNKIMQRRLDANTGCKTR